MVNPFNNQKQGDPQTPIFCARAGTPVRFRLLHPDGQGHFPDNVWVLNGHVWQEEPYAPDAAGNGSALLGLNPLSQWMGSRDGFGPGNHFDILLGSAGGALSVPGDYFYESFPVFQLTAGTWGVFRVNGSPQDETACEQLAATPVTPAAATPGALLGAPEKAKPVKKDPSERFLRNLPPREPKK
jgi:hypothetical protein